MFAVVTAKKTHLRPGGVVQFPGTWSEYQTLIAQRGEQVIPRLKYCHGKIFLMSPLPEHGCSADLLADIVKAILASLDQNYVAYTPITIALPEVSGIEPDYCFYINRTYAKTIGIAGDFN